MRNLVRRISSADRWLGVFLLVAILTTYGTVMLVTSHVPAAQPHHVTATPTYDATCAQDGYDAPECYLNPAGADTVIYWARCNKAGHYEVSVTQTRYDAAQLHTEQFFPIPANFYREVLADPIMTCDPVPLRD